MRAGQELKSDSRLVRDVGLTEGHAIHAIITPNANVYTEPAQPLAEAEEAASPATLLAQQVRLSSCMTALFACTPAAICKGASWCCMSCLGARESAAVCMCAQASFYDVLLCLADWCPPVHAVKAQATRLLDMLPTDQHILALLKAAITSPSPAEALAPLLAPSAPGAAGSPRAAAALKPARLLYTLQVCHPPGTSPSARAQRRPWWKLIYL
jgi:hypothetical protein